MQSLHRSWSREDNHFNTGCLDARLDASAIGLSIPLWVGIPISERGNIWVSPSVSNSGIDVDWSRSVEKNGVSSAAYVEGSRSMESIMTRRIVVHLKVVDASTAIGTGHLKSKPVDLFTRLQGYSNGRIISSFARLYVG